MKTTRRIKSSKRRELVARKSQQTKRKTKTQNTNRNTGQNEETAPPGASQSPTFWPAAFLFFAFKLILFTIVSISGPTKIAICTEHRQAPQRRRIRKTGKPSACLSFCLRPPSHPVHQQIGQQAGGEDRKKPSKQTVTK